MRNAHILRMPELDYAGNEAFNSIATNLLFAGDKITKIVITSCQAAEGKSYVSMQLLANLARRGYSVALIDADMRRSFIVKKYNVRLEQGDDMEFFGLAHYLAGKCSLQDCIYQTDMYGACLIPAGRDVSNPLTLIGTDRFEKMMKDLSASFDYVLVDAPPIGLVIDAAQIAGQCDGTLFVVENDKTHLRDLTSCIDQMKQSGCPILGCILNKVRYDTLSSKRYYNRGYYKKYGESYYRREDDKDSGSRRRRART